MEIGGYPITYLMFLSSPGGEWAGTVFSRQ